MCLNQYSDAQEDSAVPIQAAQIDPQLIQKPSKLHSTNN